MKVQNIMRGFLDALYPPVCLVCGRLSQGIYPHCCTDCFDSFERIGSVCCELCGEPFSETQPPHHCLACIRKRPPFQWCRGVFLYRGALAEVLSGFKYKGLVHLEGCLKDALSEGLEALDSLPAAELLIPVPLSKKGLWKRQFNQSYILGDLTARHLGLQIQVDALRKTGSRTQVGLTGKERIRNAEKSFMPGRSIERVRGRSVLLFDDVYTTGATVRACSKILRKAGAEVWVLTFARAGKSTGAWEHGRGGKG